MTLTLFVMISGGGKGVIGPGSSNSLANARQKSKKEGTYPVFQFPLCL